MEDATEDGSSAAAIRALAANSIATHTARKRQIEAELDQLSQTTRDLAHQEAAVLHSVHELQRSFLTAKLRRSKLVEKHTNNLGPPELWRQGMLFEFFLVWRRQRRLQREAGGLA